LDVFWEQSLEYAAKEDEQGEAHYLPFEYEALNFLQLIRVDLNYPAEEFHLLFHGSFLFLDHGNRPKVFLALLFFKSKRHNQVFNDSLPKDLSEQILLEQSEE
jgi:hypothetical protein